MDFTSKSNQKPYVNAGFFLADIRTILLPYIDTFRGREVLAQEIAVVLMAHRSVGVSDDVIRIPSGVRGINYRAMKIMRLSNSERRHITTSRKQWRGPMSGEHFMRLV
jgi:hypothetical protein